MDISKPNNANKFASFERNVFFFLCSGGTKFVHNFRNSNHLKNVVSSAHTFLVWCYEIPRAIFAICVCVLSVLANEADLVVQVRPLPQVPMIR